MKTKFLLTCVLTLGLSAVLGSCVFGIGTPVAISNGIYEAKYPALALQPDGTKHIVWQQTQIIGIGQTTESIMYRRTNFGEADLQYSYSPPAGYEYNAPDVAVTDGGYAYLVWVKINKNDPGDKSGCFDIIPPQGATALLCRELSDYTFSTHIESPPKVEARGEFVYSVFNAPFETGGIRVRFRQLRILDDSSGWVSPASNYRDFAYSIAIDSLHKLHVVWSRNIGGFITNYYNSNASVDASGNMNRLRTLNSPGTANMRIAVGGTPTEEAFAVFSDTMNHSITAYHCGVVTCSNPMPSFDVPMDDSWYPYNSDLAVINNYLYLTFHGYNADTGLSNSEIFTYIYPSANPPTRLTVDINNDIYPHIEDGGNAPVITWINGDGDDYSIKVYDQTNGIRTVRELENLATFAGSEELVAKNGWVAGTWMDYYSVSDTTTSVWFGFNAHLLNLPLVVK